MNSHNSAASARLRVGIALDSLAVPAWVAKVVRDLRAADFVHLALIIVHDGQPRKSLWQRLMRRARSSGLFGLYEWLDYRLFRKDSDAFAPVDLGASPWHIEIAHIRPVATRHGDQFAQADVKRLQDASLDVLLYLGSRLLCG